MIEIRRIQGNSREDANIPNQPFSLWGRMIPSLQDGRWDYRTVGQDNNLSACLFYLHHGFSIGGFDNRSYDGTSQEGKSDIYFYRDI